MKKLETALVVLDKPKHAQTALSRALELQAASGAHLHLVSFCWNAMSEEAQLFDAHQRRALKKEVMRQRQSWLHDLVLDSGLTAADVTIEVAWAQDIAEWLASHLARQPADLVLKSVHHSRTLLHTPLDWSLIRQLPVPILLAAARRPRRKSRDVLATVDLRNTDRRHRTLNFRVLDAAATFAELHGSRMHCVAVVEVSEVLRDLDFIDARRVRRDAVAKTSELLSGMLEPYDVPASRVHRPGGKVGQMVAATARKIDAKLVVVGSASRRSPGVELLGGSAEKILEKVPCDVLTVHP